MLFMIFVFGFGIVVQAKNVTLSEMVEVINDGIITKEFIKAKKAEIDDKTKEKKWTEVNVSAYTEDGMLYVDYEYSNKDEVVAGGVEAKILEDNLTLKSIINYNEKDDYLYEREVELHNLIPLWEIEASDGFKEIQEYVESDYISELNRIIDRCYRQEMHVCRMSVRTYGDWEHVSDVELNEEPANYVLSVLKEEKREADNDRLMGILTVVAIVLVVLMLILKSASKEPKKTRF